ncbi:MAG: acetate/propionate family kinase [Azospirillaceae bacterium]|nr:acetate/propionate family kinase [Azospirillaceae bacterium]
MSHNDAYLIVNAGSSSLKFSVFQALETGGLEAVFNGQIAGIGTQPSFQAKDAQRHVLADRTWSANEASDRPTLLRFALDWITERLGSARLLAVGHRVVAGGREFAHPVLVTEAVLEGLERLVPLSPLHQPHHIAAIRAIRDLHPALPQVACFDSAFHHDMPLAAQTYALPRALTDEGVRRYGAHGLSFEYVAYRLRQIEPDLADGHVVVCHLGNGSSLCAIHAGRGVDTTMGFTVLEGVPMGTRPGIVDPGILLYLMREKGMGADELEKLLYHQSGFLGVSGISNDMRVLLESDDPRAAETVELFCFNVAKQIGAMAASMGGLDAIVFTAGIGENSPPVRARVGAKLEWLGVKIDQNANQSKAPRISSASSRIPVLIIPTDEERMIARHTARILGRAVDGASATPAPKA